MRKKIAHFFAFNLLGKFVPPLVGLAVLPILLQCLGKAKFGEFGALMSVTLMLSILDFGITKSLVRKLAADDAEIVSKFGGYRDVFWGAFIFQASLGLIGASCVLALFFMLGYLQSLHLFDARSLLQFIILIVGFSLAVASGVSRAFYEGRNRFAELNIIRSCFSILTYLSPVLVLQVIQYESWVFCVVMLVKSLESLILMVLTLRRERIGLLKTISWSQFGSLLPFGVWVMLSNILTPLIAYGERFVVVSVLGLIAFADYYVAIELVSRLLIIVGALATATFTLESKFAVEASKHADLEFLPVVVVVAYTLMAVFLIFEANYLLNVWLGIENTTLIAQVLNILTVGLVFNAVAMTFLNKVYAQGHSKKVFYSYCLQMPVFLVSVWLLANMVGILGVAVAWTVRVILDFFVLLLLESGFSIRRFVRWSLKILISFSLVSICSAAAFYFVNKWMPENNFIRISLEVFFCIAVLTALVLRPKLLVRKSYA